MMESIVFSLGFLADCSHVSSLVSSFSLLSTLARRPTYRLSDPAPTSAPSKKISFWDFPQGSVSLVNIFSSFFLLCLFLGSYYYPPSLPFFFLLAPLCDLFSHHTWSPPPPPPSPPTRPSYYKTYLVFGIRN